jgi:alpha-glucoside transport system substrate-binding protein
MAVGKRRLAALGLALGLGLAMSGCLQSDDDGDGDSGGASNEKTGDKKVTILGAFGGDEQAAFEDALADYESESGIDIEYTADQDFTTTIVQKVNSGQAPDIGLFPQPGGLLDLTDDEVPLEDVIDLDAIEQTLIPGFLEAATKDGKVYGAPMRMAVKSIVWYPKPAYTDAGYPTEVASYQDLLTLSQQIADAGTPPWCMGWESDQATGWVGTDWLEEMVLRVGGPDVYDQWVTHEIPFDDPTIVQALDEFGKIAKDPNMVLGGENAILNTGFADAMTPAFDPKPGCYLMRQGNFATGFFPDDIQADLDGTVGTFYFPHFDGGYDGDPVLGGGDLAAAFTSDDDDVNKVMEYLTSDKFGGAWAQAGGWLSPHKTFDASQYADETTRTIAQSAAEADVFRFDGSDLMPADVGSGTFWTGMVDWISGQSSEDTLKAIDESWPSS